MLHRVRLFISFGTLIYATSSSAQYLTTYTAQLALDDYEHFSGEYRLDIRGERAAMYSPSYPKDGSFKDNGGSVHIVTADADQRLILTDLKACTISYTTHYGGNGIDGDWSILTDTVQTLDWQITGKSKVCTQDYTCRQAIVSTGGRTYEAWFIPSLPTKIGLWKLHGLPGLTAELKSTDGKIAFELKKVEASPKTPLPQHTVGKAKTYAELRQQVIRVLLKIESMSDGSVQMTMPDPPANAHFEVSKWTFIRDFRQKKIQPARKS